MISSAGSVMRWVYRAPGTRINGAASYTVGEYQAATSQKAHSMNATELVRDPVCGMDVDPVWASAAGLTSEHDGQTYYFCGRGCKLEFEDHPSNVLDAAPASAMGTEAPQ